MLDEERGQKTQLSNPSTPENDKKRQFKKYNFNLKKMERVMDKSPKIPIIEVQTENSVSPKIHFDFEAEIFDKMDRMQLSVDFKKFVTGREAKKNALIQSSHLRTS